MLDFIVDFYCHELRLAIEVDGSSHHYNYDYDSYRQAELEKYRVQLLRFDDLEVKKNLQNVMRTLQAFAIDIKAPKNNTNTHRQNCLQKTVTIAQ